MNCLEAINTIKIYYEINLFELDTRTPYKLCFKLSCPFACRYSGRNRIASLRKGQPNQEFGALLILTSILEKNYLIETFYGLGENLDAPEQRGVALIENNNDIVDNLTRLDFRQLLPDDYLVKVDRLVWLTA